MPFNAFTRPLALGALGLSLFVSAACGGDDDAPANGDSGSSEGSGSSGAGAGAKGGKYDACKLLTAEELQAATGEKMDEGDSDYVEFPMGQAICTWGSTGETSLAIAQVSVLRDSGLSDSIRKQNYSVERLFKEGKALYSDPIEPVSGIGNEAHRIGNSLNVLFDGMSISVSIGRPNVQTAELVTMAKLASGRVPK